MVGAEYEVLRVDGKPPQRPKHRGAVTIVPLLVLDEGHHILSVRHSPWLSDGEVWQSVVVAVRVRRGARYRLFDEDGRPVLREVEQ